MAAVSNTKDLLDMDDSDDDDDMPNTRLDLHPTKKVTPEEFLGPNAKLVDFDDLVSRPSPASMFA